MARVLTTTGIISASLLIVAHAHGQPAYSIKKIGPLPEDPGSRAEAINNAAQIAGWSIGPFGERPYRWSDGLIEMLPITGASTDNIAFGMNNRGDVVGRTHFPGAISNGALWVQSDTGEWSVTDLGVLPGFAFSQANDIADSGTLIVGDVDDAFDLWMATAWEYDPDASPPWQIMNLGALPNYYGSFAYGVNSAGTAVGASYIPFQQRTATRWMRTHTGWTIEALPYLPSGFAQSYAYAVNENGITTGWAMASTGLHHVVLWNDGGIVDLGAYPNEDTRGLDLNIHNHVVGDTWARAVLARDGQIHDLNDLIPPDTDWVLRSAAGINDHGQITGSGTINGIWHSYLLTPATMTLDGPEPGVVSEPNTFTLTAASDEECFLYYSFSAGEAAISGCSGVVLNLDSPELLAVFPGATSITIQLPDAFAGETVYFQAVNPGGCAVSNVIRHS